MQHNETQTAVITMPLTSYTQTTDLFTTLTHQHQFHVHTRTLRCSCFQVCSATYWKSHQLLVSAPPNV